ncbi:MAG: hypothetical protein IPP82_09215 [Xanthomonadales bacterium]|nr:hypothetical protein [Xanthomonadales bacterium]
MIQQGKSMGILCSIDFPHWQPLESGCLERRCGFGMGKIGIEDHFAPVKFATDSEIPCADSEMLTARSGRACHRRA